MSTAKGTFRTVPLVIDIAADSGLITTQQSFVKNTSTPKESLFNIIISVSLALGTTNCPLPLPLLREVQLMCSQRALITSN